MSQPQESGFYRDRNKYEFFSYDLLVKCTEVSTFLIKKERLHWLYAKGVHLESPIHDIQWAEHNLWFVKICSRSKSCWEIACKGCLLKSDHLFLRENRVYSTSKIIETDDFCRKKSNFCYTSQTKDWTEKFMATRFLFLWDLQRVFFQHQNRSTHHNLMRFFIITTCFILKSFSSLFHFSC